MVHVVVGEYNIRMCKLHTYTQVFRHPEHIQTGVYLWAHHEKIVVIDQTLAFVGGIDLCFGRWDNACHKLHDQGSASHLTESSVMVCNILYVCLSLRVLSAHIISLRLSQTSIST